MASRGTGVVVGGIFLLSSQIVFDSMQEKAFAFQTFVKKKRTLKSPAKVPERLRPQV